MIPNLPLSSKNKKRQSNHHAAFHLPGIATLTDPFCFFRRGLTIQQFSVTFSKSGNPLSSSISRDPLGASRYPCTGAAKPRDLKQGAKAMRCDLSGVLGWQDEIATGYVCIVYIYICHIYIYLYLVYLYVYVSVYMYMYMYKHTCYIMITWFTHDLLTVWRPQTHVNW